MIADSAANSAGLRLLPGQGLLVVGHGTRDPVGVSELLDLVAQVRARLAPAPVEPGFLELAQPTIDQGIEALAAAGVEQVVVLPLLLFAAGHVKQDIPQAVGQAVARRRHMTSVQAPYLGCDSNLLELSTTRFDQTLANGPELELSSTVTLMVGRGSHDPMANAEMCQFARLRWEQRRTGWLEVGFTAMTEPSVEQALSVCAQLPYNSVVVQPHLLFRGQLVDRIGQLVGQASETFPNKCWRVVGHLGPHRLLAEAALSRLSRLQGMDR